jgi:hypothetical protein
VPKLCVSLEEEDYRGMDFGWEIHRLLDANPPQAGNFSI